MKKNVFIKKHLNPRYFEYPKEGSHIVMYAYKTDSSVKQQRFNWFGALSSDTELIERIKDNTPELKNFRLVFALDENSIFEMALNS